METPTYEEKFQDFIKSVIKPKLLESLEYDSFKIIYNNKEIVLENICTFNTVYDLKLAIYEKFELENYAAPNNQLIFLEQFMKGGNQVVDFEWEEYTLKNPLFVVSGKEPVLSHFVTSEGSKKINDITFYDNVLLETRLKNKKIKTLYLYFFKDIISLYNGVKPIPEKEFNGRIYPYFPLLKMNQEYPNESEKNVLQTKYNLYKKKKEYLQKIEGLIQENYPLVSFSFIGIRYLQMTFETNELDSGIDSLFYDMDVNETRPYLRLLPVGTTPITKIHLKDETENIPSIFEPNLIKNWSNEKSPIPDKDTIIGKISLKTTLINLPYIYSTIRILSNGFFDVTIQPPKDIRKIDPIDLDNPVKEILESIKIVNKNKNLPELRSTNLIFALKLPTNVRLTKKQFEKRLQLFKPFFQEISPLPNDQPFIMLRYKLVDNYVNEDNIFIFLTLLTNKKILKGDATISEAIQLVSEEFQLDIETSRKKVSEWLSQRNEVQIITTGETKEHVPFNNPGTDIAIYQTKSYYTFHLSNINGVVNLQRIITALSLLFSLDEELLIVSSKDTIQLQLAEKKVNKILQDTKSEAESETSDEEDIAIDDTFEDEFMYGFPSESSESDEESSDIDDKVRSIKEEIRKDSIPADIEVKGSQIETAEIKKEDEEEIKEKGLANFFLKKLKEADSGLFDYSPKNPSEKQFVQMCAANEMRQPAVLTREQYDAMREEYGDRVIFQEYPLPEGVKDIVNVRSNPDEIITVLRYGSNPRRENYFICSEYFCTRDEIAVLKKDFISTTIKDDDGTVKKTKPRNTCPFCLGKLITNRKNPGENETVLQRIPKRASDKRHVWINFLKKSTHPDGLKLPCCFVRPSSIVFKDTESGFLKKKKLEKQKEEDVDFDDDDDDDIIERLESGLPEFDYATTLNRIDKKYIIGLSDKYQPLEIGERDGPQIGVLPKELNELFEQDITKIISRVGNPQKILPNSKGFLRIGVENRGRYKYDSFLAAVAPYYLRNSAYEMKLRISELMTSVKLFVNLNYGNLVLEFYDPNYDIKEVTDKAVWADKNLNIEYNENNKEEIDRIIKSYYKFKEFLISDTTTKEYRQFASLFAQPGLLQAGIGRPGINFIVIDIKEDNSVSVRCPPFGYHKQYMKNNDIAFLLHHYSGTWEPIFYFDNIVTGLTSHIPYSLVLQNVNNPSWPSAAKKIYNEYISSCETPSRIIYTSQSYIDAKAIIPLKEAENNLMKIKSKGFSYTGILRDSYNHVSAIVCSEDNKSGKRLNVLVPVIDDGLIGNSINKQIYLTPEDIQYENIEDTIRIYNQYILPAFLRYSKAYKPTSIINLESDKFIVGLQLENLLYINVAKAKISQVSLPVEEIDEMEWEINKNIIFGSDDSLKLKDVKGLKKDEIEEIYQHLRLTFSNWLDLKGSVVKANLENEIIFNSKISLNDKRKRLIVLFSSLISNWFSTETSKTPYTSLLRKDCTEISKENKHLCTDKCVFTNEGKCKIHISETYKDINLANYLMLKLFDEILRYAEKRREIFENEISQLVFLNKPIRIGDQYIVPENSPEWSDFLRFSFIKSKDETPKFFEEMSSKKNTEEGKEEVDREGVISLKELPNSLKNILNQADPKTKLLKYYEVTKEQSLTPLLEEFKEKIDPKLIGYTNEVVFNRKMLSDIYKKLKAGIIQINMITKEFDFDKNVTAIGLKNSELKDIYIILITPESRGFLAKNSNIELDFNDLPTILRPNSISPPPLPFLLP